MHPTAKKGNSWNKNPNHLAKPAKKWPQKTKKQFFSLETKQLQPPSSSGRPPRRPRRTRPPPPWRWPSLPPEPWDPHWPPPEPKEKRMEKTWLVVYLSFIFLGERTWLVLLGCVCVFWCYVLHILLRGIKHLEARISCFCCGSGNSYVRIIRAKETSNSEVSKDSIPDTSFQICRVLRHLLYHSAHTYSTWAMSSSTCSEVLSSDPSGCKTVYSTSNSPEAFILNTWDQTYKHFHLFLRFITTNVANRLHTDFSSFSSTICFNRAPTGDVGKVAWSAAVSIACVKKKNSHHTQTPQRLG